MNSQGARRQRPRRLRGGRESAGDLDRRQSGGDRRPRQRDRHPGRHHQVDARLHDPGLPPAPRATRENDLADGLRARSRAPGRCSRRGRWRDGHRNARGQAHDPHINNEPKITHTRMTSARSSPARSCWPNLPRARSRHPPEEDRGGRREEVGAAAAASKVPKDISRSGSGTRDGVWAPRAGRRPRDRHSPTTFRLPAALGNLAARPPGGTSSCAAGRLRRVSIDRVPAWQGGRVLGACRAAAGGGRLPG